VTDLDRLLSEAVPDGTFGGARPTPTRRSLPRDLQRTTAEEAAMHQRVLRRAVAASAARHIAAGPSHLKPVPAAPDQPDSPANPTTEEHAA
jgi:hypothetical protein